MRRFLVTLCLVTLLSAGFIQATSQFSNQLSSNPANVFISPIKTIESQPALSQRTSRSLVSQSDFEFAEVTVEPGLPVTSLGFPSPTLIAQQTDLSEWTHREHLYDFADQVTNGISGQVVGVFVPEVLSLPVLQQPEGENAYVSTQDGTATQFAAPGEYGVVGLLAHNYLSGQKFFELTPGQEVALIYGDRQVQFFQISRIEQYQALEPNSPYSDFINLNDPSQTVISSSELFKQVYTTENQVVFQTCIEAFGDPSWGRIFVVAEPIEPLVLMD